MCQVFVSTDEETNSSADKVKAEEMQILFTPQHLVYICQIKYLGLLKSSSALFCHCVSVIHKLSMDQAMFIDRFSQFSL